MLVFLDSFGLFQLLQCASFPATSSSGSDRIRTHPDLPKLPIPKALDELQRLPWNLPHVFRFDGQVSEAGHPFVAGNHQATAEPGGSFCARRAAVQKQDRETCAELARSEERFKAT